VFLCSWAFSKKGKKKKKKNALISTGKEHLQEVS